ncbi:MAG: hypothetical protein ACI3Y5_09295 [Prevotella sp.]
MEDKQRQRKDFTEVWTPDSDDRILKELIESDGELAEEERAIASLIGSRTYSEEEMDSWTGEEGCAMFDSIMSLRRRRRLYRAAAGIAAAVCCLMVIMLGLRDDRQQTGEPISKNGLSSRPTDRIESTRQWTAQVSPHSSLAENRDKDNVTAAEEHAGTTGMMETGSSRKDGSGAAGLTATRHMTMAADRGETTPTGNREAVMTDFHIPAEDVRAVEERLKSIEDSVCMAHVERTISEDRQLGALVGRMLAKAGSY